MADTKITALTAITTVDPAVDVLPIVDVSDTTMAASGTTKKITSNQILGAGGTATLASATITGDLTVDTSTLKVDSANNRVGIGTASPIDVFQISSQNPNIYLTDSGIAGSDQVNLYFGPNTIPTYSGILVDISNDNFNIRHNSSTRLSIGATGIFTWQNVGGVAGTAMTLNSTGLGVGVVPSAGKFEVQESGTGAGIGGIFASTASGGGNPGVVFRTASTNRWSLSLTGSAGAESIRFYDINNSATRLLIDSSGNVGIGVTPSAWTTLRGLQNGRANLVGYASNSEGAWLTNNAFYDGIWKYQTSAQASHYQQLSGVHSWSIAGTGTAGNAITFTQAMTLDSGGSLSVGATSALNSVRIFAERSGGSVAGFNRTTSDGTNVLFYRQGSIVGDVSVTTTGTTFNSTSDYRLKEDVQPLVGGLARVSALKPSIYKWKSNGSSGEGFLAHELAEVVPAAVSGEKDAVNEDGSIKAQSIDMSRVVPILVAAIQELAAEVNALKNA